MLYFEIYFDSIATTRCESAVERGNDLLRAKGFFRNERYGEDVLYVWFWRRFCAVLVMLMGERQKIAVDRSKVR